MIVPVDRGAVRAVSLRVYLLRPGRTPHTNLGLSDLAVGDPGRAAKYFAEALWLDRQSATAREGLARARQAQ
ncbi:MAG: hypothetical protein ACT4QD_24950 [Acidobacteriota bacterium]